MENFRLATWAVLTTIVHHYVLADSALSHANGCHDRGNIRLQCNITGQIISFDSIHYGWNKKPDVCDLTAGGCNKGPHLGGVVIEDFLKIFHAHCTNKTSCNITVPQQTDLLQDCMESNKTSYAVIYYQCISEMNGESNQSPTSITPSPKTPLPTTPSPTTPSPTTPDVLISDQTPADISEPPDVNPTDNSTSDNIGGPDLTTRETSTTTGSAGSGDELKGNKGDNMTAILAGSITGAVVLLILITLVVILVIRRKRTDKQPENGTQLCNNHTEGTTNPAFTSYDEPFSNNPKGSEVSSKQHDQVGTVQVTHRRESNTSHLYAEVQDVQTGRVRLPTLPSDEYADVYYSVNKINSEGEHATLPPAEEDQNHSTELPASCTGGDVYTQPLKPHLNSHTHQRGIAESSQCPASKPKPPPLLPKPGHISASSSRNTKGIPHEDVGGDLYAQPVKAAEKFEMVKNEIEEQASQPEDTSNIPHEEIGGDLYAQPVKATEKFEMMENEIYE